MFNFKMDLISPGMKLMQVRILLKLCLIMISIYKIQLYKNSIKLLLKRIFLKISLPLLFDNNYCFFDSQLMSKTIIHRNRSSFHIEKLYNRKIMRQLNQQQKQSSSMHISRKISNEIQNKLELSQCIRDVMHKSSKKIKDFYQKSRFTIEHLNEQKKDLKKYVKDIYGLKKIQNKVLKLKNRILPQQHNLSKVERKLNEIVYIQNQGHCKKQENKGIYSRILYPKDQKQDIIFGQNEVINKYWNQLQRESKLSHEALVKIKQNRVNILIRQNMDPNQDITQIQQIKVNLNKKLNQSMTDFKKNTDCWSQSKYIMKEHNLRTKYSSLDTSNDAIQLQQPKQRQTNKFGFAKEIVQKSFIDYLKHKKERKIFLNRLNKELIEGQDAVKLYSFVKGGYILDPFDIEGQFISLKRFNQAKQSFQTLGELYKTIKGECLNGKNNSSQDNNGARSFKSVVYVNQMNGKIAPKQLLRIMKQKKIVR